jgi:sialic acid synthase SpsE
MSNIILDFGSANTCKNDKRYVKKMIDALCAVDKKNHEVIIKWQLFKNAGDNIPLKKEVFEYAYDYAKKKGYRTTASVFDLESLKYLLTFDIPFVKIANRRDLYYLIDHVPRSLNVIVSYDNKAYLTKYLGIIPMYCVSDYPATIDQYHVGGAEHADSVSDHTKNLNLFNFEYIDRSIYRIMLKRWDYIEMHYALKDSTGLDAQCGVCKTPEMLKEIL